MPDKSAQGERSESSTKICIWMPEQVRHDELIRACLMYNSTIPPIM